MNMLYGLGFYRCDFATCAVRFLLRHFVVVVVVVFVFLHGDGGQLGWFVFIRIRNTKPWNHFHSKE